MHTWSPPPRVDEEKAAGTVTRGSEWFTIPRGGRAKQKNILNHRREIIPDWRPATSQKMF